MLFYAKSTGGFYDSAIHGINIPADAIDESKWSVTHAQLMDAQASGKTITADAEGHPIAVEPISLMTLGQVQVAQVTKISAACAAALTTGFTSSALGTAHIYPSQDDDQRNLQSAVSAGVAAPSNWTTPIWCASNDAWSFTAHTAAQVQQVNTDWLAHRVAVQQKYADLITRINAATSIAEVQAIDW
ncbi:hypothetical protein LMG19087_02541 [Ralstonia wenshanensis]|uniref:DUF4376 domain-containing protein n=1 Tax=Ralstonia wenshanensis TaxID=2842456 RepID=UPI0028F5E7EB|nr:hypothetical protein [Ralstonia wenshanensis]CAJ0815774.1 hypothetical protein LMG19087_02541 [Ralstonia wenshanensis]